MAASKHTVIRPPVGRPPNHPFPHEEPDYLQDQRRPFDLVDAFRRPLWDSDDAALIRDFN